MKYNKDMTPEQRREIPDNLMKVIYDKDDDVLFGSRYVKGKVMYKYLPAELMEDGIPFIVTVSVSYDGKGNSNLPPDADIRNYTDLPKVFTNNKFSI